ncbi:MAG: 16S rRNA (cytosine(1402)-N(4))-methyltransferase [Chlamydiae bacterium]|nr:16S rRNA (cytosine(1402)-N(4))-methyltransferase [Chlamydiota bacterium]
MNRDETIHISVMADEVIEGFAPLSLKVFYEGTVGGGGHARRILASHPETEIYIGCDKDPHALEVAEKILSPWRHKVILIQGDFADLDHHLQDRGIDQVEGFFLT